MSMSRPAFWILAVLAGGRRHGYQIMREAALSSEGLVTLKPTTLYAALERLERDGSIQQDGEEIVDGRVRRYYRITEAGRSHYRSKCEEWELTKDVIERFTKGEST